MSCLTQLVAEGYQLPVLVGYSVHAFTFIADRLVMVQDGFTGEEGVIMTPERVPRRDKLLESLPEIQSEFAYQNAVVSCITDREKRGKPFTKAEVWAECWTRPPVFDKLLRSTH